MSDDSDRTASLMTPAKLAELKDRPRPAASPAAWLDQLASDAGSGHARRLVELQAQLEAQARDRQDGTLLSALQALAEALGRVDFALLQPKGWLARATGRGKGDAASFAAQVEHVQRAGEDLRDALRAFQRGHAAQAGACERALVECEVEVRAIEKIMDQGARWLQDMRAQLKEREAQPGHADAQRRIAEDSRRCELLVQRLKLLRAATAAAQPLVEASRSVTARRSRLVDEVQQLLEGDWKAWQQALVPLAEQAQSSGAAPGALEPAGAVHQALQRAVGEAAGECAQVQARAATLGEELAALRQPLQDAV